MKKIGQDHWDWSKNSLKIVGYLEAQYCLQEVWYDSHDRSSPVHTVYILTLIEFEIEMWKDDLRSCGENIFADFVYFYDRGVGTWPWCVALNHYIGSVYKG